MIKAIGCLIRIVGGILFLSTLRDKSYTLTSEFNKLTEQLVRMVALD